MIWKSSAENTHIAERFFRTEFKATFEYAILERINCVFSYHSQYSLRWPRSFKQSATRLAGQPLNAPSVGGLRDCNRDEAAATPQHASKRTTQLFQRFGDSLFDLDNRGNWGFSQINGTVNLLTYNP
jgi:hypothetical protein